MRTLFLKGIFTLIAVCAFFSCRKNQLPGDKPGQEPEQYSSKVATDWFDLEADVIRANGYGPGPAGRVIAYAGVALYESFVPAMPGYKSVFKKATGFEFPKENSKKYYWPACANAALAEILKKIFAADGEESMDKIKSLEASYRNEFAKNHSSEMMTLSESFGKLVADSIFEWSNRDGSQFPFIDYEPELPVPPGQWEPTPPFFIPGVASNWGDLRSFVPNIANETQPPAPTPYSETPGSPFYNMVNEVYVASTTLTHADSLLIMTWADVPGNYNVHTHSTKVLTQLIKEKDFDLEDAVLAYMLHGIAVNDATISTFKTKYTYKLIRPITYIRRVMGHEGYNTVIPTPPHPEYTAAHATVSAASAEILRHFFGNNYAFTDHTHDNSYGPMHYNTIEDYEKSSGWSRVLGGLHYKPSVEVGVNQGRQVAKKVIDYFGKKE